MIGSDGGGREEGDEEGAIRDGASEKITRGTHLTAVHPALFSFFPSECFFSFSFFFRVLFNNVVVVAVLVLRRSRLIPWMTFP